MDIQKFCRENDFSFEEISPVWDSAVALAEYVLQRMPSIGFLSRAKRLNSFIVCCENLENALEKEELSELTGIVALLLMRASNSQFDKAYTMFSIMVMQGRIRVVELNDFTYKLARAINPYI